MGGMRGQIASRAPFKRKRPQTVFARHSDGEHLVAFAFPKADGAFFQQQPVESAGRQVKGDIAIGKM